MSFYNLSDNLDFLDDSPKIMHFTFYSFIQIYSILNFNINIVSYFNSHILYSNNIFFNQHQLCFFDSPKTREPVQ